MPPKVFKTQQRRQGLLFYVYHQKKFQFFLQIIGCIDYQKDNSHECPMWQQANVREQWSHLHAGRWSSLRSLPPLRSCPSALCPCVLANFLHHDTKTLLARITVSWRTASMKPARLTWNTQCAEWLCRLESSLYERQAESQQPTVVQIRALVSLPQPATSPAQEN